MDASAFTFPTDFAGETTPVVLERLKASGITRVVVAANYHAARDLFPHNPRYRVHAIQGGTLFCDADRSGKSRIGRSCPRHTLEAPYRFGGIAADCHIEGVYVDAWLNACHIDNWSMPDDVKCRNAFGDVDHSTICPSNPETANFATALVEDVAAEGADGIVMEATHFGTLVHGYHHERWFHRPSELVRYLLSLCFCTSCCAGVAARGADPERLRAQVRRCVDDEFGAAWTRDAAGCATPSLELTTIEDAVGDEMRVLWAHRQHAVDELCRRVGSAAESADCRLQLVDVSGAIKGYATGNVIGAPGPIAPWLLGWNLAAATQRSHPLVLLAYCAEAGRVREELATWRDDFRIPMGRVTVVLRPALPDCRSKQDLCTKVASCREAGVGEVAFYHYGLIDLSALEWIRCALQST